MLIGTTTKSRLKALRTPELWWAWYPVRLADSRWAWLCHVYRYYDAWYWKEENRVMRGRRIYSKELPPRRGRRPAIPTLRHAAYEVFDKS